jgi:hypothetical protein
MKFAMDGVYICAAFYTYYVELLAMALDEFIAEKQDEYHGFIYLWLSCWPLSVLNTFYALLYFGCKNTQLGFVTHSEICGTCTAVNIMYICIESETLKYSPLSQLRCCQERCSVNEYEVSFY